MNKRAYRVVLCDPNGPERTAEYTDERSRFKTYDEAKTECTRRNRLLLAANGPPKGPKFKFWYVDNSKNALPDCLLGVMRDNAAVPDEPKMPVKLIYPANRRLRKARY